MTSPRGSLDTPLTPDFYDYEWAALTSARLANGTVTVAWADGATLDCYSLWLAENAHGLGVEPKSREGTIDPADLPRPTDLVAATVGPDGALELSWNGGLAARVHPGWLRHVADRAHLPASFLPARETWTARDLPEPPTVDGSRVLDDRDVLTEWLTLLVRFGLARLTGTPADVDYLAELAARIGPIRDSNFGAVWSVQAKVEPESTAYTGLNLGQHTDLPTRETPPGFQFLHCVENSCSGGWSRMTDGLAVAAELAANHPDEYEALTTLRWVFFNRSVDDDHRWSGPIIDHGGPGQPLTLRAFYPVRAFADLAPADVPRAYVALRRFSEVAHDPRFQVRYPFRVGDLVGFDNRVVLHGRDAFDPVSGARHLRGCYIDHDDVFSRLRVLRRRRATATTT
jgi:gamma-butyrobetaine dioxygenase